MGLLGTMSAIGTALGPSLGGVLIAWLGWRAIFLISAPLGIATFLLALRALPADRPSDARPIGAASIPVGTSLLALTLGGLCTGHDDGPRQFGPLNIALLLAAAVGVGLFVRRRDAAPPRRSIRLTMFRDPALSAGLAMSTLVSTVLMATLVVGPFYLAQGLGLDAAMVGAVLSVGSAGRRADRRAGRPHRRPSGRTPDDRGRTDRDRGRLPAARLAAGDARHRRATSRPSWS